MTWNFQPVAGPYGITEGPVWDGEWVIFTDIPNERIYRYDPRSDDVRRIADNTGGANGLKLGPDGTLYACEMTGQKVSRLTASEKTDVATHYEGHHLNSPNDIDITETGQVWFTDPPYQIDWTDLDFELSHGSVYRTDNGTESGLQRVTQDTEKPNGILVSKTDNQIYIAETNYAEGGDQELRAYPLTDDGPLAEYTILHDFAPHRGVDGMCLDRDGNIIAAAGWDEGGPGPMVYVFNPAGAVLEKHPFPGEGPTNCTFGDRDRRTLYVTSHDGRLYQAQTDRVGNRQPPTATPYRRTLEIPAG